MNAILEQKDLLDLGNAIASSLGRASVLGERVFIQTPVLLPSGSYTVVAIDPQGGGGFRVSDLGQGDDEAFSLDLTSVYHHQAQEIATLSGVAFRDGNITLQNVSHSQLVGAVTVVANAVSRALTQTQLKAEQRRKSEQTQKLIRRLKDIFTPDAVTQEAELKGVSTHRWRVDALVEFQGRKAVFDVVYPHQTSIAFASTKFLDLASREEAPARVAVVHNKKAFSELLTVVAQAANVIEDDASDKTYRSVAEAA
ncbi:hypothetical protein [Gluconobacter oxydans]|uniref:hypothetical protein n=1 Tax=Gluconobacter oxydans TaxID=442 RepID=UPI001CD915DD|nr:hypothetical protein [Gluconobacter oxydans]